MTITLTREEAEQVIKLLDTFDTFNDFTDVREPLRAKLNEPEPPVINGIDCSCGRKWRVEGGVISASGAPEPEPVAWMEIENYLDEENLWCERKVLSEYDNGRNMPLYTSPPQREWIGLTEEEMAAAWSQSKGDVLYRLKPFSQAIEAKLKEKNGF